jgi:hypothetical protein
MSVHAYITAQAKYGPTSKSLQKVQKVKEQKTPQNHAVGFESVREYACWHSSTGATAISAATATATATAIAAMQ